MNSPYLTQAPGNVWTLESEFLPAPVPVPNWLVQMAGEDSAKLARALGRIYGIGRRVGFAEGQGAAQANMRAALGIEAAPALPDAAAESRDIAEARALARDAEESAAKIESAKAADFRAFAGQNVQTAQNARTPGRAAAFMGRADAFAHAAAHLKAGSAEGDGLRQYADSVSAGFLAALRETDAAENAAQR